MSNQNDMPFVCDEAKCGMRFINIDHLTAHMKKHEMSLALNTGGSEGTSTAQHFLDQTPTPTKCLKNYEEIGLFQDLPKNPFDDAYKKALDPDASPLPGPATNELNTPTLILNDIPRKSHNLVTPSPLTHPNFVSKKAEAEKKIKNSLSVVSTHDKTQSASRLPSKIPTTFVVQHPDSTSVESPSADTKASHIGTRSSPVETEVSPHSTTTVGSSPSHPVADLRPNHVTTLSRSGQPQVKLENAEDASQQPCTMQVLLQLPTGETVPVNIPATINNIHMIGGHQQLQQQQKKEVYVLPAQQPPPLLPAQSIEQTQLRQDVNPTSSLSASVALKQKLKAQLQNQLSPTAKAVESSGTPAGTFLATSTTGSSSATTPLMLNIGSPGPASLASLDSPKTESNLSDGEFMPDAKRQKMSPESTDPEERRRKFLERNRAAAARCRQKRKTWISNLERKADDLSSVNLRLQNEVKLLRGEVAQLKTLLLAHKDCPVTQQQKSQGQLHHIILTEGNSLPTGPDLAQVVPTGDGAGVSHEQLQLGQTFVTFVQEPQEEDLGRDTIKRD